MTTVSLYKNGEFAQIFWIERSLTALPAEAGRVVASWEEIDGKPITDWPDGYHEIDEQYKAVPKPLEATLFFKQGDRRVIMWDEQEGDAVVDRAREVAATEILDGRAASAWADGTHIISSAHRKES